MRLPAPLLLLLQLGAAVSSLGATELRLLPASQVWLDGTTNVHAWHCVGASLDAELSIDTPVAEIEERLDAWQGRASDSRLDPGDLPLSWKADLELRIPISALRCGNPAMEHDMRKALRAGRYPAIEYRFLRLHEASYTPAGAVPSFSLKVEGEISLAGTSRPVVIDVSATRLTSQHFRLRGGMPLRMTDFGIKPPVALLGLIRARDEIWVSVDLEVRLEENGSAFVAAREPPTPAPAAH